MKRSRGGGIKSDGSSLVELLVSMTILSFILIVLGMALEVSLDRFRIGADSSQSRLAGQAALQWIETDAASVIASRPANLPRLSAVSKRQREIFGRRLIFPTEIDRINGKDTGITRSFQNSDAAFGSLAFVTRLPMSAQFNPDHESSRFSEKSGISRSTSWDATAQPGIAGYYVAYTKNSPLSDDDTASMKLYRHFRPHGQSLAQGYANGFLLRCSLEMNDEFDETEPYAVRPLDQINSASIRRGLFENEDQPFLLAKFVTDANDPEPVPATQPWPSNPDPDSLMSPPPSLNPDRGSSSAWRDPEDPVHDTVFADEALCENVVRFELHPFKRVDVRNPAIPGGIEPLLMNAEALNAHLGLAGGSEWPCLVVPDYIDITLSLIDETTARRLLTHDDWIIDWGNQSPSAWSTARRTVEQSLQTFRLRVQFTISST